MFKKSGTKIKLIAKILFWVGAVLSVLLGLLIMLAGSVSMSLNSQSVSLSGAPLFILGLLFILLGLVSSYIGSLLLHAYGELVDKTKENNYLLTRIADHTKHLSVDVDKMVRDPDFGDKPQYPGSKDLPDGGNGSFAPDHRV